MTKPRPALRKRPSWARQIALLAVALVLFAVLASAVEWSRLWETLRSAEPAPLFGAFVLTLFFPLLNAIRWGSVLKACGMALPDRQVFMITMACWPVGTLTPGKAGELLKATAVRDRVLGVGSVVAERFIDVLVLATFSLVCGLIWWSPWAIVIGLGVFGAATGFLLFSVMIARLLEGKPIGAKISAFLSVFTGRLTRRPDLLAVCVTSSALNWFLSMLQLWLLLSAFGVSVPLVMVMAVLPAATFAGLIPITPAGMGTRDAALLFFATGLIDPAAMLAASIVYTLFGYFFLGVAGLPFLHHLMPGGTTHDRS